jgi:serine/threonine protein kinase
MESKIIGKGVYGCVYYPAPKCKNKVNKEFYSNKYVLKYGDIDNDIEISKELLKIDPNQIFYIYVYPYDDCQLNDNDKNKCELDEDEIDDIKARFMNYGGISMKNYSNITENQYINWLYHLINALAILRNNKIIHFDIRPDNIMIFNDIPRLIDFGLSKKEINVSKSDLLNAMDSHKLFWLNSKFDSKILDKISPYTIDLWSLSNIFYRLIKNKDIKNILFKCLDLDCTKNVYQIQSELDLYFINKIKTFCKTKNKNILLEFPESIRRIFIYYAKKVKNKTSKIVIETLS